MGSIKPALKIRTDGDSDIGLGHVVRCISLGYMLKNDFTINFFALEIPDLLKNEITLNGWNVSILEKESDFIKNISGDEIVVLDGYQFNSEYQKIVKSKGCKLVCIDDFHNQYFYADLVINHAPGITKDDYKGEPYTEYLLGPDYALLRPEFLESKTLKKEKNSESRKRIFICFGGSDSKNLTAKVLSWLPSKEYLITVVLGNSYQHKNTLSQVIGKRKDLEITVKKSLSAIQMRGELEQADVAIVPASGILFETISIGLPVISGYYTDNQINVYSGFKDYKVFYDAKNFSKGSFLKAFSKLKKSENHDIARNQLNCIDNFSPKRIRSNILGSVLQVREATMHDMRQYFEWANDDKVRANAFNPEKIIWENHISWFKKKISSDSTKMFFFEINKKGVGQVRFDKKEGVWDIDYMLDEKFRGIGLGEKIIKKGLAKLISEEKKVKVQANVKINNTSSIKVFDRLNFKKNKFKEGVIQFTYEERI